MSRLLALSLPLAAICATQVLEGMKQKAIGAGNVLDGRDDTVKSSDTDRINAIALPAPLEVGGIGNNLVGGAGNMKLYGGDILGDDGSGKRRRQRDGNDSIGDGDDGDDTLKGNAGNNKVGGDYSLFGDAGNDRVYGDDGTDKRRQRRGGNDPIGAGGQTWRDVAGTDTVQAAAT